MLSKADEAKITIDFNFIDPNVIRYIANRSYEFSQESADTLLQRLRTEWNAYLTEGIKRGMSVYDLTEKIEEIFRGTEREEWWRARRIARTESVGASNMGYLEGMKQANVPYKMWVSAGDAYVRDSHRYLNGKVVAINDFFVAKSGAKMQGPGDPKGGPAEIVNCRCTLQGVWSLK